MLWLHLTSVFTVCWILTLLFASSVGVNSCSWEFLSVVLGITLDFHNQVKPKLSFEELQ